MGGLADAEIGPTTSSAPSRAIGTDRPVRDPGARGPASASPPHLETWHRLNPATDDVAPEHERLQCLPGVQWVCRYDKLPEPDLELNWDRTIGMFHGRDFAFTQDDCPDWFPTEICEATEQVIVGPITYAVDEGGAFKTGHALLFTDGEGRRAAVRVLVRRGVRVPLVRIVRGRDGGEPDGASGLHLRTMRSRLDAGRRGATARPLGVGLLRQRWRVVGIGQAWPSQKGSRWTWSARSRKMLQERSLPTSRVKGTRAQIVLARADWRSCAGADFGAQWVASRRDGGGAEPAE